MISINKACSIIQFQDWAFLSGPEVVKNNVLGEDDFMFDGMDGYIVDADKISTNNVYENFKYLWLVFRFRSFLENLRFC